MYSLWSPAISLNDEFLDIHDQSRQNIRNYPLCDQIFSYSWWRHQMETFCAFLAICTGNSPVTGDFPAQRPVTRSFDVFFDLRRNKRLSKQWWGWWFETLSRPFWRHCNVIYIIDSIQAMGRSNYTKIAMKLEYDVWEMMVQFIMNLNDGYVK